MKNYTISTFKVRLKVEDTGPPAEHVGTSIEAARILRAIFDGLDADQEHFVLLTVNMKNRVEGYKVLASGGVGSAPVDLKILFRSALALGGAALFVAHNHPSGDPEPSQEDVDLTVAVSKAAALLQYRLLDHIILGSGRHYSFAEEEHPAIGAA